MGKHSGDSAVDRGNWRHSGPSDEQREIGRTNWRYRQEEDGEEQEKEPTRKHLIVDRIEAACGLAIAAAMIVFILGGWYAFTVYDGAHQVPVTCTAIKADAGSAPFTGEVVSIKTSDCGWVGLIGDAVGKDADRTASEFQRGHRYEFEMGAASHKFEPFVRLIRSNPHVYSFREIGS